MKYLTQMRTQLFSVAYLSIMPRVQVGLMCDGHIHSPSSVLFQVATCWTTLIMVAYLSNTVNMIMPDLVLRVVLMFMNR